MGRMEFHPTYSTTSREEFSVYYMKIREQDGFFFLKKIKSKNARLSDTSRRRGYQNLNAYAVEFQSDKTDGFPSIPNPLILTASAFADGNSGRILM